MSSTWFAVSLVFVRSSVVHLQVDLGAESIDLQNLLAAVEKRYGVKFEDDELEDYSTVAGLYQLICSKA